MLRDDSWIHRNVESIEFEDESRVRRQVALDFTVPSSAATIVIGQDVLIPVQLIEKGVIRGLDVRDQAGRAVPVLTSDENSELAREILLSQARTHLSAEPRPNVAAALRAIPATREPTPFALDKIRAELSGSDQAEFDILLDVPSVWSFRFWFNFLLVARVRGRPGDRIILKRSYDEEFRESGGFIPFEANGFFRATSYHLEVLAPSETVIADSNLQVFALVNEGGHARFERAWIAGDRRTDRAHLYGRRSAVPRRLFDAPGRAAVALVWVRPRMSLVEPVLLVSALLSTVFLVGILVHREGWTTDDIGAAAVVVAFPGLIAGYLASTGHRLARKLTRGVQLAAFWTTVVSLGAALSLVVTPPVRESGLPAMSLLGVIAVVGAAFLCPVMVREVLATRFLEVNSEGTNAPGRILGPLSQTRTWSRLAVALAAVGAALLSWDVGPAIPWAHHRLPIRSWLWLGCGGVSLLTTAYLVVALSRAWYNSHLKFR
jgi:hypothetical protein